MSPKARSVSMFLQFFVAASILALVSAQGSSSSAGGAAASSSAGTVVASSTGSAPPPPSGQWVVTYAYGLTSTCSGSPYQVTVDNVVCHKQLNGAYWYYAICGTNTIAEYECYDAMCSQCKPATQTPKTCQSLLFVSTQTVCLPYVPSPIGFGQTQYSTAGCMGTVEAAYYRSITGNCNLNNGNYTQLTCTASTYTQKTCPKSDTTCISSACTALTQNLGCTSAGGSHIANVCAACGLKASLSALLLAIVAAFVIRQ